MNKDIAVGPVVDQCHGCAHIFENRCRIYYLPEVKWIAGVCPMATHRKKAAEQKEKFVDPIKASKRKMGKK
jgi:hypothetical protein